MKRKKIKIIESEEEKQAQSIIEKAIVRFLLNRGTFYASLLCQMSRKAVKKEELHGSPAAVTAGTNGKITLLYVPEELKKYTMDKVCIILEHECLHVVLEHFIRGKGHIPEISLLAADLAVNSLIKDAFSPMLLAGKEPFFDLPSGKTYEYYYYALCKKAKENKSAGAECKSPNCNVEKWKKQLENGAKLSEDDIPLIKEVIKNAAEEARRHGDLPENVEQYVNAGKPKLNWKRLLRYHVGAHLKGNTRRTWIKTNRRFDDIEGIERGRFGNVWLAIDTSGSIGNDELSSFLSEMIAISKLTRTPVTVLECDAAIQQEYKLTNKTKVTMKGGGGTDFRPVFKRLEDENKPLLVYFTDMEGSFPDTTNVKTLWVSTTKNANPPFGRVVYL